MTETLIIAAPSSGAGKTVATLALLALMRARGVRVAAAKVGPDYIDPAFHAAATGRDCLNLDPWAMSDAELAARLSQAADGAELLLIEGVMGLFDGAADGSAATADVAARFSLPVLLVIDAGRMGASAAALAHGFASLRNDVAVAGVLFTNVASDTHASMLRAAVEEQAGLAVVGALRRDAALAQPSRHLGLVQAREHGALDVLLRAAAEQAAEHVSLCRLANLTRPLPKIDGDAPALPPLGQRIAIARDDAFAFLYPHWLNDWRAAGAEMTFFSPLADETVPAEAGAVFLPGGYPELHAGQLAAAATFRASLHAAAERGALIYGECGGYMALGEGLIDADGLRHDMTGLLPVVTSFAERRLHLGYRAMAHAAPLPFPAALRGHEFHYARETERGDAPALFTDITDATGQPRPDAGLRVGNVMGSFLHIISEAPS
ncbi:MAG TPA: cobyrinate a,c-diamide synthase [Thermopetrobacter sp.]|nr:cobyrinate a,c-diamide synthase [Thermopetrobacter sp.]